MPIDTLPDSPESEKAILGALLLEHITRSGVWGKCEDKLLPEHFCNPAHRQLYEAIVGLHSRKIGVDSILLTGALQEAGLLETSGGPGYIAELQAETMTHWFFDQYMEVVIDYSHRRQILKTIKKLEKSIKETPEEILLAANSVKKALQAWEEKAEPSEEPDKLKWLAAVEDLEKKYEQRLEKGEGVCLGISTSLPTMDRLDYGIQPETFTIIAARPSQGKTKLYGQMVLSAARQGCKSLLFSMEESASQFIQEILCQDRAITTDAFEGNIKEKEPQLLTRSAGVLRDFIYVDDSPSLTVAQIRKRAKRFMAKHPDTKIIGIDHHMLVKHSQRREATDESMLSEISIGISQLKKELGVAVILLCQINREGAKGRPRMNHIKGSGQFEADADKLWIIDMEDDNTGSTRKGVLWKDKGRGTPLGSIHVEFSKDHLLFKEI